YGEIAAIPRKRPDMGFDDDGLMPGPPAPIGGAPRIGGMIDHLARAENVLGLEHRRRIRDIDLVVDAEFVASAGHYTRNFGEEPAVVAARHRAGSFQQQVDASCRRRPQAKARAVRRWLRTELPRIHAAPAK